MSNIVDAIWVR